MTSKTSKKGRPKGKKDSQPRKPRKKKRTKAERSLAAKKAVETKQQKKQAEAGKIPQVTAYPRAAENKQFEKLLDQAAPKQPDAKRESQDERDGLLQVEDVAEWVSYPFSLWATTQKLAQLKITDKEARSVAEPLTRILNRHAVGRVIPPDVLDGLQIAGRVTPLMKRRFDMIKAERSRRSDTGPAAGGHGGPPRQPQGIARGK